MREFIAEHTARLAYAEFGLDVARQAMLVARIVPCRKQPRQLKGAPACPQGDFDPLRAQAVWDRMPKLQRPDSQKFINWSLPSAHGLVSKDRAVLRLRRRCAPLFGVMTPAEAVSSGCRLPTPQHEKPPNLG